MSDLTTIISNIYEPAIWEPAFIQLTTDKSALVQSGIAAADPEVVDASNKGGNTVSMPFWQDLPNDPDTASTISSVATQTDTVITPGGLSMGKDIAVKQYRTKAWNVSPIVKYVAGSDPVAVALSRYATWWAREEQRLTLKTLTGVFADATIAAALENDIAAAEGATTNAANLISSAAIEDTRFKLGDAFDKFTAIIMHSVPFKRLRNLDLIDFAPVSSQNPLAGSQPLYMGLRVLVDDNMTKTVAGSGCKYDTYLFGQGAFARVDVPLESGDPTIEVFREPLKGTGAGSTSIITRRMFILHPRGIAFSGTPAAIYPSDAELAADNWTQAYVTKNIRIARLRTNG